MNKALFVACILSTSLAVVGAQTKPQAPVDFTTTVQLTGPMGGAATTLDIHIERYLTDKERTPLVEALKKGYSAFVPALRQGPVIGYVKVKDQKFDLRWAQQETVDLKQTITVATATPIYFVGAGRVDAKPKEGYDLGVIRLEVDTIGLGKGDLWPAAKVKATPNGQGVQIDDYGGQAAPITSVRRLI